MRVPVGGGSPQPVPTGGALDDLACSLRAAGCVLRVQEAGRAVVFYALDPVRGKGEELARLPWAAMGMAGWSVSPDGTSLALPAAGLSSVRLVRLARGSSLMFVNARGETTWLPETPLTTWAVPSPDGRRLAYVDQSAVDSNVWLLQRR